jgi:hypothetical protein
VRPDLPGDLAADRRTASDLGEEIIAALTSGPRGKLGLARSLGVSRSDPTFNDALRSVAGRVERVGLRRRYRLRA